MTAPHTDDAVLRAEGITKVFSGTVALQEVDFIVHRGRVNVLIGENGAGKSTLMKILAGVETATSGRLLLEGREIRINGPRDAARHGIGIIYQELNLFPNLSVAENIFMAREVTRRGVVIDEKEQEQRARAILARFNQPIDPRSLVGDLRVGQQQIVEIARALSQNVRILIMDEPTSALSTAEVESLFRVIGELKAQGVSIIYISHKLDELLRIGDYVTVLRDGQLIAEAPAADIDVNWIVEKMVGRDTESFFHHEEHERGASLLEVTNLTLPKTLGPEDLLRDVSFTLRAGEILGIYGLMGAGRTELFECLMGMRSGYAGELRLNGKPVIGQTVADRIAQGMMLVPEDRQRQGLVRTLSVAGNISLANLSKFTKGFFLSQPDEAREVARLIGELGIKTSNAQQLIGSLSGGNQQKVVVAKALLTAPTVLLLDEPTRGIDVGAKAEMFEIMRRLAKAGLGVIFSSSELMEALALADRILVMSKGRITGEFDRAQATEAALVAASGVGHRTRHKEQANARS
ncbi:MAG: sugar ABC transporter ATP-binding protein [Blastocatellia bacterium]|nr:sugar ABC transporter ATP-binding protein [Blastocatellia bacterium]